MRDRLDISMRASHLIALVLFAGALVLASMAFLSGDRFYLRLATEALILGGLALSVDLLLGYSGLLSLGQAMYFGIGAYTAAIVMQSTNSFWQTMGVSILAVLVSGILGGLIANRVRGVYFALITFGMAQVIAQIIYNTRELGGSDGMRVPVIEVPLGFVTFSASNPFGFFLLTLAIISLMYALIAYLLGTPFGRVIQALSANERRVPYLGYSVWLPRMIVYVVAAMVAGISGALYPMLRGFVSPELMYFAVSGNAVIMVIVGGTGTLVGALLGAMLITVLKSVIGTWTEHHHIVIGVLFMASILFLPRGIMGLIRPRIEARLWKLERDNSPQPLGPGSPRPQGRAA
jgi:branched-chain amino acid transport system permease protein